MPYSAPLSTFAQENRQRDLPRTHAFDSRAVRFFGPLKNPREDQIMAPRAGSRKGQKAEHVEASEPRPVEPQETAPRVEPPVSRPDGDDILKALGKLQRSINKTQRAVQSI